MRPIKSGPLIDQEIEELDAFLLSDDGLENAMDVSGLDGFLCAVLSGPNVIMPSEWMRGVWDSTEGKQSPEFTSAKQAQRILDLLIICSCHARYAPNHGTWPRRLRRSRRNHQIAQGQCHTAGPSALPGHKPHSRRERCLGEPWRSAQQCDSAKRDRQCREAEICDTHPEFRCRTAEAQDRWRHLSA